MARTQTNRTRALVVSIAETHGPDGPEFEVRGTVVTTKIRFVGTHDVAEAIKNVGHLSDWGSEPETSDSRHLIRDNDLDGFEVTGRSRRYPYKDGNPPEIWGAWATFGGHLIDSAKAATILRTIRRVEKALASADDPNFRRVGLGQWFVDVAKAIGAEALLFRTSGAGGFYSESAYEALPLGRGWVRIDDQYERWVARVAPEHARLEVLALNALTGDA